jgi:hypothetical protein
MKDGNKNGIGKGLAAAVVLVAGAAGASCASEQYLFRPAEQLTANVDGQPAASYPVPPESPRGSVYVTSFGVTDARVGDGKDGARRALLQIRMRVSNDSDDQPWIVDTREQILELPGVGRSRPAYVNTDRDGAPLIQIPRTDRRTIDLYYPLPQNLQSSDKVPPFEVLWSVRTGIRLVAHRTPFEKVPLYADNVRVYPEVALSFGWGPFWWYDPFYPSLTFGAPIIAHRPVPVFAPPRYHAPPRTTAQPGRSYWRGRPPGSR